MEKEKYNLDFDLVDEEYDNDISNDNIDNSRSQNSNSSAFWMIEGGEEISALSSINNDNDNIHYTTSQEEEDDEEEVIVNDDEDASITVHRLTPSTPLMGQKTLILADNRTFHP